MIVMSRSAIDAPGGFLFEWWSVFWDIFIARTNEKHSEAAASFIEVDFCNFICSFCFVNMFFFTFNHVIFHIGDIFLLYS